MTPQVSNPKSEMSCLERSLFREHEHSQRYGKLIAIQPVWPFVAESSKLPADTSLEDFWTEIDVALRSISLALFGSLLALAAVAAETPTIQLDEHRAFGYLKQFASSGRGTADRAGC